MAYNDYVTLLDDLRDKPYTFWHEPEPYPGQLEETFDKIVQSGAMGLYGDMVESLRHTLNVAMDDWLPQSWAENVCKHELAALLLVEWMRE